MRSVLPLCLCGGLTFLALMPAHAAGRTLLLELWLDGKNLDQIVPVTLTDGHLFLAASDLAALKLTVPMPAPDKDGRTDLSAIAGLQANVDEADQKLNLSLPTHALPQQLYDLAQDQRETPQMTQDATGAMLHYDFSATADNAAVLGNHIAGGANLALDVFTPDALIHATGFSSALAGQWRTARLDTSVVFDNPQTLTHLSLGDAISSMPAFARAVRFGGVEYAHDFSLRPDLDTRPLPAFFGQTAVPATVDVFSGAAQVFEQKVDPGPFTLNNLPIVSGGGTATIVTRDVLGRETTQTLSLYTASDLLAPGLSSYALDLGFLRTFYGIRSAGYDAPMASASWRRGLADMLTLEGHGEAAPGLALMSGGAALGVGDFGEVSADIAASGGKFGSGTEASLNGHARFGAFSFYVAGTTASVRYRDLASLDNGTPPPRSNGSLGVTANISRAGTLGLSWIVSKYPGEAATDFVSASWTLPLPHGIFMAATGLRDMRSHAVSMQISLNIPIGGRALASVTAADEDGQGQGLAIYDDPADPDGGFGYRLLGGWQGDGRAEADGTYIGPHWSADAGMSIENAVPAVRGDVDGALVLMGGGLFAVHDPGSAVALVETGDPGVRVYRENRTAAVSDANGEALITGLNPHAPNHIGVDPRDYSFDALVEKTEFTVAPPNLGGVVVDLRPVSHHPLLAILALGSGDAVPLGAKVRLDSGGEPIIVGHDGEIFVEDLDRPMGAVVELGASRCRVLLQPQKNAQAMPRTETLLCLPEAEHAY
jgi:outer membrane usher protein